MKLAFARLNQEISGLEVELLGEEGLLYDDWTMRRPELVDFTGRDAGYRYLRSKGNSIEGGTSEVLLNIVAERVLGLPVRAAHRQGRRLEGPRPMTRAPSPTCCTRRRKRRCAPPSATCSPTAATRRA